MDGLKGEGVQLTEQDLRKLIPHVMAQNKVGEEEAGRTLEELRGSFGERAGKAVEFVLWKYEEGGQWTFFEGFSISYS
jgi:hypothetical protein